MKDFFKDIFEYHHHFNQQFSDQVIAHQDLIPVELQNLFSHVLNAHQVWNSRILREPSFKVWEVHVPGDYKRIDEQNYSNTLRILDQKDLAGNVAYFDSKGTPFTNTVSEILFHVNNHSTHHKAQLVSKFKALGITPLVTDYIIYKRSIS